MMHDEILTVAREIGLVRDEDNWFGTDIDDSSRHISSDDLILFATVIAARERQRCCKIVFGQCSSDNVAQRTVDAINKVEM